MDGLVALAGGAAGVATGGARAAGGERESSLPPMREDLRLIRAASNQDGSPAWMIHDPVSNRFFRIGWAEQAMLARWSLARASRIAAAIERETPLAVAADSVNAFAVFLKNNQLLRASDEAAARDLAATAARAKESKLRWLLHNYLFVRVPLVRPQRFLAATAPYIAFLFTRTFAWIVVALTVLGIGLAARQWDTFVHTFSDVFTVEGIAGYLLALSFAKTLHELGHAYTATRAGVRVAHMGVAFLVLWPMLYTDTSESWRLTDRAKRLRIAAAGITVEFALAGLATLAWSLTSDGALKSTFFFLATTSWIITLGINASPFMRFDGYFLLSDALDMPNLHARAFALARVSLRRRLLGWNEADPEIIDGRRRGLLVAFAWLTWIYRLGIFVGIAVAVYLFFFKLLGIVLFAVEVIWFIARPVWTEARVWWRRRGESRPLHLVAGTMLLAGSIGLLAWPWQIPVHAPAWLRASDQQALYSPVPARIVSLREEGPVKVGELIAILDSPDTRSKAAQAAILADALARQLDQSVGRSDGAARRAGFAEELRERLAEWEAQRAELRRLELRAPYDGVLRDRERQLAPGVWVNAKQPLAMIVARGARVAEVFVSEQAVRRLRVGTPALFYGVAEPNAPYKGTIANIDPTPTAMLPHPMLATPHGGPIPIVGDPKMLAPRDALYRVLVRIDDRAEGEHAMRAGTVRLEGVATSVLADWGRSLAAIFVRESGF